LFALLFLWQLPTQHLGQTTTIFGRQQFQGHSIEHWVNDGLNDNFLFTHRLRVEREIYIGELSKLKDALLPIFGAIGGMFVPAGLFLIFNYGTATQSGAGIPMATDIAFALGILSLLGNRVPTSLKVFLTALAVIDDLGAIIIIAIFYTKTLLWTNLIHCVRNFCFAFVFNRMKVQKPYSILNWWCCNVVFYASFRRSRHYNRSAFGFCNSIWQRRRKINFIHFATLFTQASCIYHFTHFCISKHSHSF
jgi:Na+/H+ antiporter NhaA